MKDKTEENLSELQQHIERAYDVMLNSKQSYYTLLKEAGMRWKKTQKRNPKADPEWVKKQEISV